MKENKAFVIVYRRGGYVEILSHHETFQSAHRELKKIMNVTASPEKKYYFISNKFYQREYKKQN